MSTRTDPGRIVYELVRYEYWVDGEPWDGVSLVKGIEARNDDRSTHGIVMFELLDNTTLRVETFPGATAAEVDGFTDAARLYER